MRLFILLVMLGKLTGSAESQSLFPTDLVAKNAQIEKAGSGYSFTEGSSAASDGSVYFTDQPNDKIYIWNESQGISLFLEGTGRSNGTYFDKNGNLVTCADLNNSLMLFDRDKKATTVYDKGFENKHFNGPNDLWIDPHGGIYFTDPYYHRDYWPADHKQLLDVQAVYYLNPEGKVIRVIDDLQQPNGIAGTPDGKFLYVADIRGRITWRYSINPDGTLGNKTNFAPDGSDGMTLDEEGNVYLTFGKVIIYNSKGEKAGEIELPENPSNLCFGGINKNILFITARTSVYTLKMKVRGVE